MAWDLSCLDWEQRLAEGRSLVPTLPHLDLVEGNRAVQVFNKLRLGDVPGTPTLEEACGDWFRDIVRALFGGFDAVTHRRMIRELFLLVPKKNAKALALDTLIATPSGFTTIGAIQVGEEVIDVDGRPTKVQAKSELFLGHDCYEVEFSTGERVVCDAKHLWVTDAHADRDRQPRDQRSQPMATVKTTAEIAKQVTVKSGQLTISNHRTALCGRLELPEADLPIPPYVLGVWLGDGTTNEAVITAGKEDADHIVREIEATGQSVAIKGYDPRSGAARISLAEPGRTVWLPYRFRSAAVALGLFGNKHIPAIYRRASYPQRLELLRGLMDSDGSISKAGQAVYVTTLPTLRDDVLELINSLGFKGSWSEHRARLDGIDCGPCWSIQFWPFDGPAVTSIPRKVSRQKASGAKNAARSRTRQIVAVRPVPSVPTQCISVASETKQFLVTRSLIPTHNTTFGALMMLTALLLNRRPNAPFILTAPVQDVSEIAFGAIASAIELDEVLKKKFHVRDHLKTVIHRTTKAELQIMTFDPSVLTGQKVAGVLIDELHVVAKMHKAASAIRQLRGGMLPFPEAFIAFITTQSEEPPSGVFKSELDKARAIRDGDTVGSMLPVLYELPMKIQKDLNAWQAPAVWRLVTPNLDRSVSIEGLIEGKETAEKTSREELIAWASQHLNIQIGLSLHSNGWAGARYWEQQARSEITLEYILEVCEVVVVGIDGGGLDDLLGLCVLGRHPVTREWLSWCRAWGHSSVLDRNKAEIPRFLDFERDGDLVLIEQMGEDVAEVAEIVALCEASGKLHKIGVDPAGIGAVLDALVEAKVPEDKVIGISQGWKMSGTIKTAERKLVEGTWIHADQALMNWSVGNAKTVPVGNAINITKQVSGSAKIDPFMAALDAVTLMALNPKPRGKPSYKIYTLG